MAVDQTTVQNEKAVQLGSARIEYRDSRSVAPYTNLGVADTIAYTEEITALDQTPDNGATPDRALGVASQTVTLSFNLWETDQQNIAGIRSGIDLFTQVAGTVQTDVQQTVTSGSWSFNVPILLDGQNSDGTQPTIDSVTAATDGALVLNMDYFVTEIDRQFYITVRDSVTVTTTAQNLTIQTDYTPAARDRRTTGGLTNQTPIEIRLTNRNPDTADAADAAANAGISLNDAIWRTTQYVFYRGTVSAGEAVTFPAETGTETIIRYPFEGTFLNDPTRTAGDQLFSVEKFIETRTT